MKIVALLISAPEMLEALKEIKDDPHHNLTMGMTEKLEKLIQKAEGRES